MLRDDLCAARVGRCSEHRPIQSAEAADPQVRVRQVADANGEIQLLRRRGRHAGQTRQARCRVPDSASETGLALGSAAYSGPNRLDVPMRMVPARRRSLASRSSRAPSMVASARRMRSAKWSPAVGMQAPRRPRHQLHAEILLEPRQRPAYRLRRSAKANCCRRQAALVNDSQKRRVVRKRGQGHSLEK